MSKRFVWVLTSCIALWAGEATAEGGSVMGGNTVGDGATVIHGQLGWPGISATLLHGVSPVFDVGGKFTFNYGLEGTTNVVPGIKLQAALRLNIVDKGNINFGLHFEPGLGFYFFPGGALVGITLPVGLAVGFPVTPQLKLSAGMDFPLFIYFTPVAGVSFPILFGGGLEYAFQPNVALTFQLRMGPAIGSGGALFAFDALFGVAFHL